MLLALLLSCSLSAAATPAPQEEGVVHVTTDKGEVHIGALRTASFRLDTSFGSAEVEADQIQEIRFGSPTVITVLDGTVLEGELKLRSLKLEIERKSKSLRTSKLVSLVRPVVRAAGSGPFAGSWFSNYGPMELTQDGDRVSGTYGYEGEGEIEGTVEDDTLTLQWTDGFNNQGAGHFRAWDDGETLTGKYETTKQQELFWGAYRLAPAPAEALPGEVSHGQTEAWLNYHLRVPKDFAEDGTYTAIALFHGSNMSARSYVETFAAAWPDLAERYVLVGFDGERLSAASGGGKRVYNASYVEFSGHEVGERWRHRQTPALVAGSLEQLQGELPIERWFIGGHSQGGFLTWAVTMFYPDLVAGAFPTSGNLLVQCDPQFFDDKALEASQRDTPIAIVHGENDRVVDFSGATYPYQVFQDGEFPALRLFSDPNAAHMFARLPVDKAVGWLEAMTARDAASLVTAAEGFFAEGEYRDVQAALDRAEVAQGAGAESTRIARLKGQIEAEAEKARGSLLEDLRADRGNAWVEPFWEFRRQFGFTKAAREVLAAYKKLRDEHEPKAREIFYEARGNGDEDARRRLHLRIVHDYYASSYFPLVSRWVQ